MSGSDDENDKKIKPGGRADLEEGAGLEIEDYAPEGDVALDTEGETPSWLKAGSRLDEESWGPVTGGEELEPEPDPQAFTEPPSWVEIDADFEAEETEEDPDGDAAEPGPEETKSAPAKRVVVHESRRTRRVLIAVAAAAALVCGISTYMFFNDIGPFAPASQAEAPAKEEPALESEVEAVLWTTAGEDYEDLFALILEQTRDFAGTDSEDGAWQGNPEPFNDYDSFSGLTELAEGVLAADVLKTDGEYIYSINSNNLLIVRAEEGEMDLVSGIAQPSEDEFQVYFEMYVTGDRLIAVRQGLNKSALQQTPEMGDTEIPAMSIWYPFGGEIIDTAIDIFDISDRGSPVKLHTLSQSGTYGSSLMVGNHLYLITTYYGDVPKMKATDPRTFVPLYSRDGEQFTPDESDILIPPGSGWPCYTVISGIDAMGAGDFVTFKSVYGDVGTVYTSAGAVYLARMTYEEEKEAAGKLTPSGGADDQGKNYFRYTNWSETLITKMGIDSGRVEPRAQAKISGYILDEFSLDEYEGTLRILATVDHNVWYGFNNSGGVYTSEDWARLPEGSIETANALYTLGEDLSPLGGIEDIAPGERVNSGRFLKDFAYFTTYNRENPLVSVDLSDPAAPRVAGALKIHRLSEFLGIYSNGRLFGLGRETDMKTGAKQDLTLSMIDNSDPEDLKELHTLAIGGDTGFATEQNPRAVLVRADKNIVVFPAGDKYLVYGYDDATGFEKITELLIDDGGFAWGDVRGLFIDGTFYMVSPNYINAYATDLGFDRIGRLRADESAGPVSRMSSGGPAGTEPLP